MSLREGAVDGVCLARRRLVVPRAPEVEVVNAAFAEKDPAAEGDAVRGDARG